MTKSIVQYGQSLFDLALQHYGSTEGIFLLLTDNPQLVNNWHDNPIPGTEIYIKSAPINERIHQYYTTKNIIPASLYTPFLGNDGIIHTEDGIPLLTEDNLDLEVEIVI